MTDSEEPKKELSALAQAIRLLWEVREREPNKYNDINEVVAVFSTVSNNIKNVKMYKDWVKTPLTGEKKRLLARGMEIVRAENSKLADDLQIYLETEKIVDPPQTGQGAVR